MNLFTEEVQQLEQKVAKHPPNSVVFYGSSTVRMWANLATDFPHVDPLNLGFGGSTLAACAWYFERLVVPAKPRAVVLYAGDNDLGEGRQPEEVYLFFVALMNKMQQHLPSVPLWFVGIKPSPFRWGIVDHILATNVLIAAEIKRLPNTSFIDLSAVMLDKAGNPQVQLYQPDGLHLNADGYHLWQDQLRQQCSILH